MNWPRLTSLIRATFRSSKRAPWRWFHCLKKDGDGDGDGDFDDDGEEEKDSIFFFVKYF